MKEREQDSNKENPFPHQRGFLFIWKKRKERDRRASETPFRRTIPPPFLCSITHIWFLPSLLYTALIYSFFFSSSDLISVDGSFRVTSEDFSLSLLDRGSDGYRRSERKYQEKVKKKTWDLSFKGAFCSRITGAKIMEREMR